MADPVGTREALVPRVAFDTSEFASKHRVDALRAVSGDLFEITPIGEPDRYWDFHRAYRTARYLATHYRRSPAKLYYGPIFEKHYANLDKIIIRRYRRGRFFTVRDHGVFENVPGVLYFSDAFTGVYTEPTDGMTLTVDARECGLKPDKAFHVQLSEQTPFGRVIATTLDALFEILPTAQMKEADRLVDSVVALLGHAFNGRTDERSYATARAARAASMRRFVEEGADTPNLSVTALQSAFGCSRATVYRAFEKEGGLDRFIAKRNMLRAMQIFATSNPTRGLVGRTAEQLGYPDPVQFNRLFRREFSFSPSDILSNGGPDGSSDVSIERAQDLEITPWVSIF